MFGVFAALVVFAVFTFFFLLWIHDCLPYFLALSFCLMDRHFVCTAFCDQKPPSRGRAAVPRVPKIDAIDSHRWHSTSRTGRERLFREAAYCTGKTDCGRLWYNPVVETVFIVASRCVTGCAPPKRSTPHCWQETLH